MLKEDFFKICLEFALPHMDFEMCRKLHEEQQVEFRVWSVDPAQLTDRIEIKAFYACWATGGVSGSAYEKSHYVQTDLPDSNLTGLDSMLEKHFPQLTYLQFRQLTNLFEFQQFMRFEYYEETRGYTAKSLSFENAWAFLTAQGLVTP